jgi:hypothetical protein
VDGLINRRYEVFMKTLTITDAKKNLGHWLPLRPGERTSALSVAPMLFWDIPLAAKKSDVRFMKGEPTKVDDKDEWHYHIEKDTNDSALYQVIFRGEHIRLIAYTTAKSFGSSYLQGIGIGSHVDAVREKFGEPSHVSESKDGLRRIYSYEKYNVFFTLQQTQCLA